MHFFELDEADISALNDADLRELVGRLCEAELIAQNLNPKAATWGGAQEAPDGGLDVRVEHADTSEEDSFIPRSFTGFQVKKHSLAEAACTDEMLHKGSLKPVIADIAKRHGAYVIVSGADTCSDGMLQKRIRGMQTATKELGEDSGLKLDFYGRDRLCTWLRQHPSVVLWVRKTVGKPLSGWQEHGRWARTPPKINDEFLADEHACVFFPGQRDAVSTSAGLKITREKLSAPGSVVRITGLSGVGKTRFAQALFEEGVGEQALPSSEAVYADLGDDLTPSASELVAYMIANDFASYLILDNCAPDIHRRLQKQVTSSSAKLRLLTIEYDISDDKPEETEVIHLEPASEETVTALLGKRFPKLGEINCRKIAEFSGGNARVALALASRVDDDETLTNFTDEDLFKRLFEQRKGENKTLLRSAEVLSLAYSFNVSTKDFNDELLTLGAMGTLPRGELFRDHAELIRRQLCQKRGDWRAVLPHALANRLTKRALENIPLTDINAELFKPENIRLFKSCAHRIGYLHDFEPARLIAESWIANGGPLSDISVCSEEQLSALDYIAPVFPEAILTAIENAAATHPKFASRANPNFTVFVRLLTRFAYEEDTFIRAAGMLLKFSETEQKGENDNSVVSQLKQLFYLYLSGTNASPSCRQDFLNNLIQSQNPRHTEIAEELLYAAFTAHHFSSFNTFGFGARRRGTGWRPKTHQDVIDWYAGFMKLVEPLLRSNDSVKSNWAKNILGRSFRGLWSSAGLFDELERLVKSSTANGHWSELWLSIKETLGFDAKEFSPEVLVRLEALEKLTAPSDVDAEIEAYVLRNSWDHDDARRSFSEQDNWYFEKVRHLGELAATEDAYLAPVETRIWTTDTNSLLSFGRGLASGSVDVRATFERLIAIPQREKIERLNPDILCGFFDELHKHDHQTCRELQERILEIPELRPYFVNLTSYPNVAPWAAKTFAELASDPAIEPWRFVSVAYGRTHEAIGDDDICDLLEALNRRDGGIFATFKILEMRFHAMGERQYEPSDRIRNVGRDAVKQLASMHRDEIKGNFEHGGDWFGSVCLNENTPREELEEILERLLDGFANYRLYTWEVASLTSAILLSAPELFLDKVFDDSDREELLVHFLFRGRMNLMREASLNSVAVSTLLSWAGSNQSKLSKLGRTVDVYRRTDNGHQHDNPTQVVLSEHILAMLEATPDKAGLVDIMFENVHPGSWSNSLADILEVRATALAVLKEHPASEVRAKAVERLKMLEQGIAREREREHKEHAEREQRFE